MTDFVTRTEGGRIVGTLENAEPLGLTIDTYSGGYVLMVALTNTQAIEFIEAGWPIKLYRPGVRIGRNTIDEYTLVLEAKFPPAGYPCPGENSLTFTGEQRFRLNLYGREWKSYERNGVIPWLQAAEVMS